MIIKSCIIISRNLNASFTNIRILSKFKFAQFWSFQNWKFRDFKKLNITVIIIYINNININFNKFIIYL